MQNSAFHFGRCQACTFGCLFAVRSVEDRRLFLRCDVCETRWRSPGETSLPGSTPLYGRHDDEPAADADIEDAGWMPYALPVSDDE